MNPDIPFIIILIVSVIVVSTGAKQYSKSPTSSLWMIGIGSFFAVMQLVLMMTN